MYSDKEEIIKSKKRGWNKVKLEKTLASSDVELATFCIELLGEDILPYLEQKMVNVLHYPFLADMVCVKYHEHPWLNDVLGILLFEDNFYSERFIYLGRSLSYEMQMLVEIYYIKRKKTFPGSVVSWVRSNINFEALVDSGIHYMDLVQRGYTPTECFAKVTNGKLCFTPGLTPEDFILLLSSGFYPDSEKAVAGWLARSEWGVAGAFTAEQAKDLAYFGNKTALEVVSFRNPELLKILHEELNADKIDLLLTPWIKGADRAEVLEYIIEYSEEFTSENWESLGYSILRERVQLPMSFYTTFAKEFPQELIMEFVAGDEHYVNLEDYLELESLTDFLRVVDRLDYIGNPMRLQNFLSDWTAGMCDYIQKGLKGVDLKTWGKFDGFPVLVDKLTEDRIKPFVPKIGVDYFDINFK